MDRVIGTGIGLAQLRQRFIGAGLVAGGEDDPRAHLCQADGGDFADAGGRAGDDDSFSAHEKGSRR